MTEPEPVVGELTVTVSPYREKSDGLFLFE